MSELTSALERISAWHQENQSRSVFQPGLSRNVIDNLVKNLSFPIPEEIYELYEWCNGSSDDSDAILLHCWHLLPLEEAVNLRQDPFGLNFGDDIWQDDPSWFPVFKFSYGRIFYVIVLGDKKKSIVRNYDRGFDDYSVHYESVTKLLLHSAEWLELAKYHENVESWEVERSIDSKLKVKYRVHESIHPEDLRWANQ
jgi:cell wall assembly regulator SMI1